MIYNNNVVDCANLSQFYVWYPRGDFTATINTV